MDELHDTLKTYEMKVMDYKPTKKEITFKMEKVTKEKKEKSEDTTLELDDEELFSMVLRRMTLGN
ncbi:hypothetical protein KI387_005104, partial [Taxus chinensis]